MICRDRSGIEIFCDGVLGQQHRHAHHTLDAGRPRDGYRALEAWLKATDGEGPRWVHLQWHMLVFELSQGCWHDARKRFDDHILPAVAQGHAPVDGPAGLWWLRLTADFDVELPWQPLCSHARLALGGLDEPCRPRDAHVVLHHLLALAGGGDAESIDRFLALGQRGGQLAETCVLMQAARGLRAIAVGDDHLAQRWLDRCLPELTRLGGSHAQGRLLLALRRSVGGHRPVGHGQPAA